MSGEMEILFSLAGRLHVLLRRETNRIIDVEWMCSDAAYAQEVVKLACGSDSDELQRLAERVEEVHPLLHRTPVVPLRTAMEQKYTTTLR
ncbi:MAG: hypothetical protein V1879_07475 [Pseudomonadota bacterium]